MSDGALPRTKCVAHSRHVRHAAGGVSCSDTRRKAYGLTRFCGRTERFIERGSVTIPQGFLAATRSYCRSFSGSSRAPGPSGAAPQTREGNRQIRAIALLRPDTLAWHHCVWTTLMTHRGSPKEKRCTKLL